MPEGLRRGVYGAGICALVVFGLWAQGSSPVLNTVTPDRVVAGSGDLPVTLVGEGFFQSGNNGTSDPEAIWFGPEAFNQALATTFVNANTLTAVIPADLLDTPGLASIFVQNPDFFTSSSVDFQILTPIPIIDSLAPNRVAPGSGDFTLTINGSNFFGSVFGLESNLEVLWNGTPLDDFPSLDEFGTQITVDVPAALLADPQVVNVQVRNPDGQTSAPATFIVSNPIAITTESLPPGDRCSSYGAVLTAVEGIPPYTWSVNVEGPLPAGLVLDPDTGVISGVPAQSGSFPVSVTVQDIASQTDTQTFTIEIAPPLTIVTTSLAQGREGADYFQTLVAAGGIGEFTWSVISGELPPGLSLEGDTIAGIPTTPGIYSLTIEAQSGSLPCIAQQALTIEVVAELTIVTDAALPPANLCSSYSVQLETAGGAGPVEWSSTVSGSLPPGVTLSPDGLLAGIPEEAGTFVFLAHVMDQQEFSATRQFTLEVGPSDLEIVTTDVPDGAVGTEYSFQMQGEGGTGSYVWTLESGELPPGLTLSSAGLLSGTPTEPGSFLLRIGLRIEGLPCFATRTFRMRIVEGLIIDLTGELPPASVCSRYVYRLEAVGGTPPYSWSGGNGLPEGMRLSQLGSLVGTPLASGSYTFQVSVSDASGNSATREVTLVVGETNFLITTESPLPPASIGVEYDLQFEATGGTPPLTWSAMGSLPDGLTLSPQGSLAGAPIETGDFAFTINVAGGIESCGASKLFELSVLAGGPVLTSISPDSALANSAPLTVTLTGAGFQDGAIARWNGPTGTNDLVAVFISDSELAVGVSAELLAVPGVAQIAVVNPDGRASASLPFSIVGPTLSLLNPDEAPASGPGLTVQASGEGFAQNAFAMWTSGRVTTDLATTVLSDTSLEFAVPEALLAAPDVAQIAIVNPEAGRSQAIPFAVRAPSITQLDPATLTAESPGFSLTVTGANFVSASIVRWNGPSGAEDLATTFVSPSTLQAEVPAGLLATPGPAQVVVVNGAAAVSDSATLGISPIAPPPVTVTPTGPPIVTDPATVSVTLAEPAATNYTCRVSLVFEPHPSLALPEGYRNEALMFLSSGTTESECSIERGQTAAVLPEGGAFQRGTVAGRIIARLDEIQQGGVDAGLEQQPGIIEIPLSPPVITANSVRFANVTSSGFSIELSGFSTTRELVSAALTFRAAAGAQLGGSASFTVPLSEAAVAWFESEDGLQLGGTFSLSIPFTFSGSASAIGGVDVTLTNTVGTSNTVSGGPPGQ